MADRTAPTPFRRTARSPDRRQRRFIRGTGDCRGWWAYPLLWLLPLLTWMMVITRIRKIA
jgi:hypothetical protein